MSHHHHEKEWQLADDEAANADIINKMKTENFDDNDGELFTEGHYIERIHDVDGVEGVGNYAAYPVETTEEVDVIEEVPVEEVDVVEVDDIVA